VNDWVLDLDALPRPPHEVVGERVALGPLRPELFPLHTSWVNDPDVARNVFGGPHAAPRSDVEERAWLEEQTGNASNRFWLVYRLDEDRPIGAASLTEVDRDAGTATFRILIGSPRDRGGGLGTEASRLALGQGFARLGLQRIRLDVFAWNERAIAVYRRLGFREVERLPMREPRDGITWDRLVMELEREAEA
jgi:RimJ/RimL family protein N-acetyltransferase